MNYVIKFAQLSWAHILLVAFFMLAGYYFLVFDDGQTIDQQINAKKQELVQEEKSLERTKEALQDIEKFKLKLSQQSKSLKEVVEFLPTQLTLGDLLTIVQERAVQAGLKVIRSEPRDITQKVDFYEMMFIDMKVAGSFPQILSFFSLITKLPRLVTVQKINMVSKAPTKSETSLVDVETTIVGYRTVETIVDLQSEEEASSIKAENSGASVAAPNQEAK